MIYSDYYWLIKLGSVVDANMTEVPGSRNRQTAYKGILCRAGSLCIKGESRLYIEEYATHFIACGCINSAKIK